MKGKKTEKRGYGKLLDTWIPPENAGSPIGCVATSYTFSPVFFEEECLGRFLQLETDPQADGLLYLIEREEKLCQITGACALVDAHHCRGTRSLRWDLLPVRIRRGILHAKVSLLLWSDYLRIIVASANLTEEGYRRNLEVFGTLEISPNGGDAERPVLELIRFLQEVADSSAAEDKHPSPVNLRCNAILERARDLVEQWSRNRTLSPSENIEVLPVFTGPGQVSVFEQLSSIWPASVPPDQARVLSPFFVAEDSHNLPAEQIWNILRKRGSAAVSYYVLAEEVEGEDSLIVWAPISLQNSKPKGRASVSTDVFRLELDEDRPLHAKMIWLEGRSHLVYMVGSSNFTAQGMGLTKNKNIEANLVFLIRKRSQPKAFKEIRHSFPEGKKIPKSKTLNWQGMGIGIEDAPSAEVILPEAFRAAVYDKGEDISHGILKLEIGENAPEQWAICSENTEEIVYSHDRWTSEDCPFPAQLKWIENRPPSGLWVTWKGCPGKAWWPVNVLSQSSLPPPTELRNLPLELLIEILTSARPLHKVLSDRRKQLLEDGSKNERDPSVLDALKRIDSSRFLLRRTRRISWALTALRDRLERPIPTEEALDWRLRGPVGVMAVANAILKEARSEEEKGFLLAELALELSRVQPGEATGCLKRERISSELREVILDLKQKIPVWTSQETRKLREYVQEVFDEVVI